MAGRIVCGVYDSRGSREALLAAGALSRRLGLRLLTVHVTSADGASAAALAAVAVEEGADMIAVGSRSRDPAGAAALGSVSHELIAQAPCPVLVVPPGATGMGARTADRAPRASVVCGVGHSHDAVDVAGHAAMLARQLGDRLVLAHAHRRRRFFPGLSLRTARGARQRLEAAALALPPDATPELRLERGDPRAQLRAVAAEENAELIVIGSPIRGRSPTLAAGSVAADLVASAPVPVLVVTDGGWREIPAAPAEAATVAPAGSVV